MTKVFIDHQKFTTQRFGGISRYFANIVNQLKADNDFSCLLGVQISPNEYIKEEELKFNKGLWSSLINNKYKDFSYDVNRRYCISLLKKNEFDLFHPTYYDTYFVDYLKKPMVTTVHDMTYERLPEYFWAHDPLTYEKRINMEKADKIIAISETTKKDILRYSHISADKIVVIYHGIDNEKPAQTRKVTGLPEDYILFVGDRSGYKNYYLFIRAFSRLVKKHPKMKLVLTGGGKPGIIEKEYVEHLGLTDAVIHINVDDEELNYVYKNARLFVYPSLNEGFGLPILEAFKAACPMLLSDTECFREIAADAAGFFSSLDEDDLLVQMEELIQDEERRRHLIEKGLLRLKDFPIEKSINQTLALYKEFT